MLLIIPLIFISLFFLLERKGGGVISFPRIDLIWPVHKLWTMNGTSNMIVIVVSILCWFTEHFFLLNQIKADINKRRKKAISNRIHVIVWRNTNVIRDRASVIGMSNSLENKQACWLGWKIISLLTKKKLL